MMEPFNPEERANVEDAITRAERKTSGEIIVVVASASAGGFAFAIMWAALIALLVPWPLIDLTNWPVEHIYLAQLGSCARVEGFVTGIDACGQILAKHFPPGRIDQNEPNHLITLDARWTT